jgi:hypothetical protein
MKRYRTKVITAESQVPHGFKRICEITQSLVEQKQLSDAHTDGRIEAVKLMRSTTERGGPVWVDAAAARRFLAGDDVQDQKPARSANAAASDARVDAAVAAICEMNNCLTLIHATLERLASATENIATQPKTAQQELLNAVNGNGFYS